MYIETQQTYGKMRISDGNVTLAAATLTSTGYIHTVMTHPSVRGYGFGKLIMCKLLLWAYKEKIEGPFELNCYDWNTYAQRFYFGLGFTKEEHMYVLDMNDERANEYEAIITKLMADIEALQLDVDNTLYADNGMSPDHSHTMTNVPYGAKI